VHSFEGIPFEVLQREIFVINLKQYGKRYQDMAFFKKGGTQ